MTTSNAEPTQEARSSERPHTENCPGSFVGSPRSSCFRNLSEGR
jgi:hypothetical protein